MDPANPPTGSHGRTWRWYLALAAAVMVVTVGLAVSFRPDGEASAPSVITTTIATTTSTTTAPATTTTIPVDPVPPASTITATPKGRIARYDGPDGTATGTVDNFYYGYPTELPVIEQTADGWLYVRTPYKPNSSTTWIRATDAVLGSTPWAIQIDVTKMHLRLFNAGQLVVDAPVGVGTDYTPTAQGDFFVTFLQRPPSAAYGPFVMITTGHSDVLQSFDGFPDGILGIHGPIGSDGSIGTAGGRISNGCIRMHVQDQVKLSDVTSGTPVHVYASPTPA